MDTSRFDGLSKQLATGTTRRQAVAGLGALALGSAGILAVSRSTAAEVSVEDARSRCIERCINHGGGNSNHELRRRCRRRCEDR